MKNFNSIGGIPKNEIIIIMSDFNARIRRRDSRNKIKINENIKNENGDLMTLLYYE